MKISDGLTFDDVLLEPAESNVLPSNADVKSNLTKSIGLGIPLLSAAMDTVTESNLAIAMAQQGGIGVIHKNLSPELQSEEVKRVKKFESGMVINPITLTPDMPLSEVKNLTKKFGFSGFPVTEEAGGKLVGILTNRDTRFANNPNQLVKELMTAHLDEKPLVTVEEGIKLDEAKVLLHQYRLEKLVVVDEQSRCVGLITVKDIEKAQAYPEACKDQKGRLRVAAATGIGSKGYERAERLVDSEVDLIVVDTAHGHSEGVIEAVKKIKKIKNCAPILAGNIATSEGAKALIDAGADAIKVGIGPGTICTTRMVAGVGIPQFSAIVETSETAKKANIHVVADGGVKYSGDVAKAIAAGADSVMIGSLFAGTEESPGEVFLYQGRSYKSYRGMGSLGAMTTGSADRYFQEEIYDSQKLVPEGVEGRVPFKGPVSDVIYQLVGGLRASMGYTGNKTIREMQSNCKFRRITAAGLREGHVHDVKITREAPNYRLEE